MAWRLSRKSLLKAVQGEAFQPEKPGRAAAGPWLSGVETDSRKPMEGKVFFALKGPVFDGHDFLREAWRQGAAALVIHDEKRAAGFLRGADFLEGGPPNQAKPPAPFVIKTPDTLKALQDLAVFWRKKLRLKIAAVTGSCGKTTVKAFAKTLMSPLSAAASPKSYNNQWGVPLSILSAGEPGGALIQELGTSRPGEIAFLSSLCAPSVAAVTMAGPSHLEGLGSVEAVAREKKQIYLQSPGAVWVFNRDNPWTEKMFQELAPAARRALSFSRQKKGADIQLRLRRRQARLSEIGGHIQGLKGRARLPFSEEINIDNLMCACGLALGAGVSPEEIWRQIPLCRLPPGRQQWLRLRRPWPLSVLFDGYNANPASMAAFLSAFGRTAPSARRHLVLGDMRELGKDSAQFHKELAARPELLASPFVWHIGDEGGALEAGLKERGFKGRFVWTKTYRRASLPRLAGHLKSGDFLGIKGSRSLKLERLLFDLAGKKIFPAD